MSQASKLAQGGKYIALDKTRAERQIIETGIFLAYGLCVGLAKVVGAPFIFDPKINLVAFVFSAAIGIIFGFMPARRAARLDPIDALRHE